MCLYNEIYLINFLVMKMNFKKLDVYIEIYYICIYVVYFFKYIIFVIVNMFYYVFLKEFLEY